MRTTNPDFHGSCCLIDEAACGIVRGAYVVPNAGAEQSVLMQIIAHVRSKHPQVQLDGTLPEDYSRRVLKSGCVTLYNSDGLLIAQAAPNE